MTATTFVSEEAATVATETEESIDTDVCSMPDSVSDAEDEEAGASNASASPGALVGAELLAKVKDLGGADKSDLVRACGYVSTKRDGTERLNFTAFYEAVLAAKGLDIGVAKTNGKPGRSLSYTATVQGNGNLMIGKAYTSLLGARPGDEYEIRLSRKQIRLIPAGSTQDEE